MMLTYICKDVVVAVRIVDTWMIHNIGHHPMSQKDPGQMQTLLRILQIARLHFGTAYCIKFNDVLECKSGDSM